MIAPALDQSQTMGPASVLRHRDFRLFWIGALISNTGTWLQGAAVPYVLFKLTGSSVWVGLSVLASLFPGVIAGPIAGAIADRLDRRIMLFWIQFASALTAVTLAVLWVEHLRSPGTVLAVTAVSGALMGFGMPVWQGFVADLVPRESLPAAVTMNSVQFHGSRAIGPALAGLILATVGPTWAFVGNAVSYAAVMLALWFVRARPLRRTSERAGMVAELRAGLTYARGHEGIATALVLVAAVGFLGNPIVQLAPAFSERIYHVGAGAYGLLTAAFGLGAALGLYQIGRLGQRYSRASLLPWSFLILGTAVIGFGLSPTYPVGAVCVLLAGSTAVGSGVLLLTAVQTHVDDAFRGRVLGAYGMAFTASYPLGSLAQGASADLIGARANEIAVGAIILVVTGLLMSNRGRLEALDAPSPPAEVPDRSPEPPTGAPFRRRLIDPRRLSNRERFCPTGRRG